MFGESVTAPPVTEGMMRKSWKVGSRVEVFSNSAKRWYEGDIHRIFTDEDGEWIEVHYNVGTAIRLKQCPRDDVKAIRPVPIPAAPHWEGAIPAKDSPDTLGTGAAADSLPPLELDPVRESWMRGSPVEVYSRTKRKWLKGVINRIFVDTEGEWLEVRYSLRFTKQIPRDSVDIRPVAEQFKSDVIVVTQGHANLVTGIWEKVDFENTRHLDASQLFSLLSALNTGVDMDVSESIFRAIDSDGKEAIDAVQFLSWLLEACDSKADLVIKEQVFVGIDRTLKGEATISSKEFRDAQKRLKREYGHSGSSSDEEHKGRGKKKGRRRRKRDADDDIEEDGFLIVSHFTPAKPSAERMAAISAELKQRADDFMESARADEEIYGGEEGDVVADDFEEEQDEDAKNEEEDVDLDEVDVRYQPPPALDADGAEFSDFDDDCEDEERDSVPSLMGADASLQTDVLGDTKDVAYVTMTLTQKLDRLGLMGSYMICTPKDDIYGYTPAMELEAFQTACFKNSDDRGLRQVWRDVKDIQHYVLTRVAIAGLEGIRVSDMGTFIAQKFGATYSAIKKQCKLKLTDLVAFSKGVEVLEFDDDRYTTAADGSPSRRPPGADRFAVTSLIAMKMNLKQKVSFLVSMLFDKARVNNDLTLVVGKQPKGVGVSGRSRRTAVRPAAKAARKMSVGEKLLTLEDFVARLRALGLGADVVDDLEMDELFWAVAGCNGHLLSRRGVAQFFSECVDHISFEPEATECDVVKVLPKLITYARLVYRRQSVWNKYIVQRTESRWNDVSYLSLTDRRTRSHAMKALLIPKHQHKRIRSFHAMCRILNRVQYPTVVSKVEHGRDRFDLLCVCRNTDYTFRDLIEFDSEFSLAASKRSPSPPPPIRFKKGKGAKTKKIWVKKRAPRTLLQRKGVVYSEHFIAQIVGSICETVLFLHKHDCVNMNLNIDALGFDSELRPVLLDFTRVLVLKDDESTESLYSIMSSTPPELALLMGTEDSDEPPLISVELCGSVIKKCDAWRIGVLLYTLVSGQLPFKASSLSNFITSILTSSPSTPIHELKCSPQCRKLLQRLLDTAYFNRVSIKDALKDPWFKMATKEPLSIAAVGTGAVAAHMQLQSLFRLECARNWISAVIHESKSEAPQSSFALMSLMTPSSVRSTPDESGSGHAVDGWGAAAATPTTPMTDVDSVRELQDKKYFGRLDASGQRGPLKQSQLKQFIIDRIDYCPYKADKIVEALWTKKAGKRGTASKWSWQEFRRPYYQELGHSNSEVQPRLCNAIFKGLDPDGHGRAPIDECMALFSDIKLTLKPVLDRLRAAKRESKTISFEDMSSVLLLAFENGFDTTDLLSVDELVKVQASFV